MQPIEFADLLKQLRKLDRNAFDKFAEIYYGLVYYFVSRKISAEADREDLVQEVFIKFFQLNLFARFSGTTEGQFKSYIARVAINTTHDFYRKGNADYKYLSFYDLDDPAHRELLAFNATPESQLIREELQRRIDAEIASLPAHYAGVIQLRLLSYTNQEIADILQKPKGTIDSWLGRAFEILREKLGDLKAEL